MLNKFIIFNIKPSWAYGRQKSKIIKDIKEIKEQLRHFVKVLYKCEQHEVWIIKDKLEELDDKLKKLEKKKAFLNRLIAEHRDFEKGTTNTPPKINTFDIEEIKKIPLDKIVKITPSGFFVNNPFRNESSPSNSLHWHKGSNRWKDFGSGEHGDVIDLYMKLNTCDFVTACKELQGLV